MHDPCEEFGQCKKTGNLLYFQLIQLAPIRGKSGQGVVTLLNMKSIELGLDLD